ALRVMISNAKQRILVFSTAIVLTLAAPDDQQRWRLSAQLVLKPLLFREGELSLTTKPIEARALTGLLLK
ncbi:MAG TPA: hypothetical protein VM735_09725, partial [Candidatus Kapabacteria bacterium]|nr:hypothetical protein [Candidatus Kapabacteria bacterium]